jgi:hypothetical protein
MSSIILGIQSLGPSAAALINPLGSGMAPIMALFLAICCIISMCAGITVGLVSAVEAGEDQKDIALTVYNTDLALVREKKSMDFDRGISEIRYTDVAARIDPTSVSFRSLSSPEGVEILEQNYQFDLVDLDRLLQRYLETRITLLTKEQKNVYDGLLMGFDHGQLTLMDEESGEITVVQRSEIQDLRFPSLPEGLITRPTLVWLVDAEKKANQKVELSYLTGGFNWHAEYIAEVEPKETTLNLSGWVSLENNSGATYRNSNLKLVAGEIHRVEKKRPHEPSFRAMRAGMDEGAQFEEREFFEYHLYDLGRRTTIADREVKQISLFPSVAVPVKKIFNYEATRSPRIMVMLEFENSSEHNLGIPLPEGKIRVYTEDIDGGSEFVGEDWITHTPKDETVKVYVGNAFDIIGERAVTDSKKIGARVREETVEIKLRNHKKEDIQVVVTEKIWGDWKIIHSTHSPERKDATTVEFVLPVPKDGETVLTYRVRKEF